VSGLILLFERPIKVGDLVQMSDTVGTVEYIGIRASIIRTAEGSEVIVPNGNLLSNQLTNFTLSSRQRGLSIPISIGADAEPQRVMQLLAEVAAAHPMVTSSPPPQVLLLKFTADAFAYELRAWTNAAEQWAQIRSDLAVSIHAALVAAGMTIKS
jgi:potassium efflux system protein